MGLLYIILFLILAIQIVVLIFLIKKPKSLINDNNSIKFIDGLDLKLTELSNKLEKIETKFESPQTKHHSAKYSTEQETSLNGKVDFAKWKELYNKQPNDFHLIEIVANHRFEDFELAKNVYDWLMNEFNQEENIGIKRELLKLLDTLTENMLLTTSSDNYLEIKDLRVETEKLYSILTEDMKQFEIKIIENKINELDIILSKINDINTLESNSKLVQQINEIDSSIDLNTLNRDKELSEKYDKVIKKLSSKIEANKNILIKKENEKALKNAEHLKSRFENEKKAFAGYENKHVEALIRDLSLHNYENLLPTTYEYCEKVRLNLLDKLSEDQQKLYAKRSIDHKFNN